jgi:hypothetical protein
MFAPTLTVVPTGPAAGVRLDIVMAAETLGKNENATRLNENISAKDMNLRLLPYRLLIVFPLNVNEQFEQLYR